MDRAGTSLEGYQSWTTSDKLDERWMDLGQVPDLSLSKGRALLPTRIFKLSIAPCFVKIFLEKATFQAALLIVILFGDFLLPPNDAEKIKSPT